MWRGHRGDSAPYRTNNRPNASLREAGYLHPSFQSTSTNCLDEVACSAMRLNCADCVLLIAMLSGPLPETHSLIQECFAFRTSPWCCILQPWPALTRRHPIRRGLPSTWRQPRKAATSEDGSSARGGVPADFRRARHKRCQALEQGP